MTDVVRNMMNMIDIWAECFFSKSIFVLGVWFSLLVANRASVQGMGGQDCGWMISGG